MEIDVEVRKLEKELKDGLAKVDALMTAYKQIVLHDDNGCIIPAAWAKAQKIQNELSTLKFNLQDVPYELNRLKKIANGMARKAYLKQKQVDKNAVWKPPYPEIRG